MILLSIIEDDPSIRHSLELFFNEQPGTRCIATADSVETFLAMEITSAPSIILLDISLPGMSGIKGVPQIKKKFHNAQIMMLTVYDDTERIFQALCAGATGYLLKQTPLLKIKEAVISLYEGGAPMSPGIARKVVAYFNPKTAAALTEKITPREAQVLQAIEEGLSNKEVAIRLDITLETVKSHIKNIYQKLEVNSRHELIARQKK